jgi:hypothetical protein
MAAGNQGDDSQPDRLGFAFYDRFDRLLQAINLIRRIRTDQLFFSLHSVKAAHQPPRQTVFSAILHGKRRAGTPWFAACQLERGTPTPPHDVRKTL